MTYYNAWSFGDAIESMHFNVQNAFHLTNGYWFCSIPNVRRFCDSNGR